MLSCSRDKRGTIIIWTSTWLSLWSVECRERLQAGSFYMVMKSIGPMRAPIRSVWFMFKGLLRAPVAWQPPNECTKYSDLRTYLLLLSKRDPRWSWVYLKEEMYDSNLFSVFVSYLIKIQCKAIDVAFLFYFSVIIWNGQKYYHI